MKRILLICPFKDIYPPVVGGSQRYFHIIHQLSRFFDLSIIIFQDEISFRKAVIEYPAIAKVKIYSTQDYPSIKDLFSLLPPKFENAFRYRWIKKNLFGTADGNFLKYYPLLKKVLQQQTFDAVILENLSTLNSLPVLKKYGRKAKVIYNAHNVDSHLANVGINNWGVKKEYLKQIEETERNFGKMVDAVFTCSEKDRSDLIAMNNGNLLAGVVPNGVAIPTILYDLSVRLDKPGYIIFCGALWTEPNSEGLNWFCKEVWTLIRMEFPGLKLLVVGSGELPQKFAELRKIDSLEFTGRVEDVKPWYNKAAISVVPLINGSGTRLKVLEAMGLGVPLVSTKKGAEGIEYTNGKDILIADTAAEFADTVIELLKDKEKRISISQAARKLAEVKYDWNIVGDSMAKFLKGRILDKKILRLNFGYFWPEFDNKNNYFTRLLSRRYNVIISENPDFYIFTHPYYNNKKDYENYNCHRIFFGFENVRADWNICDYVVDSDYTDHPRHKRRPLWAGFVKKELTLPKDVKQFEKKKKFCCMLVSNPNAKERIDFFHKLSEYKKVDSAGRFLNNVGHSVENKKDFIKDYKFVISFENSCYPGYTTEKLIEPMLVNSIPIYWGNPSVGEDFNTKSFVNINDFKSFDEAIQYIIELDNDDQKYLELAAQPWFNENIIAEEYSEESLLDFFDFIIKDSKMRKPVAKSLYKRYMQQKTNLRNLLFSLLQSFKKT